MSNVLVQRLATVFGPPDFSGNPTAYISEIVRLTKGYADPEQHKAGDYLIRNHKPSRLKPWPSPSDIAAACQDAREANPLPKEIKPLHPDWTSEAVAKAYDLLRSDIGRRAADGGWVLSLWDFCRKRGWLPQVFEIDKIKAAASGFDHAYASLKPDTAMSASLIKLGDTMRTRRERLARHAWGEDVGREDFSVPATTDITKRMTGEKAE